MKANEFMIGDLVIFEDNIHKITDLSLCIDGSILGHVDGHDVQIFEHEISPISLTEEMLPLNGFTLEEEQQTKMYRKWLGEYLEDGFVLVVFHNFDSGPEIALHIETIPPHIPADLMVVVKNVNEMQHALRLCGLVELANNFKVC